VGICIEKETEEKLYKLDLQSCTTPSESSNYELRYQKKSIMFLLINLSTATILKPIKAWDGQNSTIVFVRLSYKFTVCFK